MSNSEPSAIVLQDIPCMCDYTSFDSNGENGSQMTEDIIRLKRRAPSRRVTDLPPVHTQ
jgi:hypothetical protein